MIEKPIQKKLRNISPLWIFTLLAFVLAGFLVFKSVTNAGEIITLNFKSAQGIQAGRTTIRYQGLEVGIIKKIILSDDLKSISAQTEIYPQAKQILRENTVFWIVSPRASIADGITGLDTLVSGNYIAVHPGDGESKYDFVAHEEPPVSAIDGTGLQLQLESVDLGSISTGAPIYYKKIRVGEVVSYKLDESKEGVITTVKIENEYASLVNSKSRFWSVSGIHADIGLSGVKVNVESLSSLLSGGISFDSPKDGESINSLQTFKLFESINETDRGVQVAIQLPDNHGIKNQHSPILYEGLEVGRLNGIEFDDNFKATQAKANIDPSMKWLLKSGTNFVIESPEISINGIKNATSLITGNTLSIHLGKGEFADKFTAKTTNDLLAENPDALVLHLKAENAAGLSEKTKIVYRGVEVGFIYATKLKKDAIDVTAVISPDYKHLIKSDTRFYEVGGVKGQVSAEGIKVEVPPLAEMVNKAISFTSEGKASIKKSFLLYQSQTHAKNAKAGMIGSQTLTLIANKLPSVSAGSPVMYKNFTVGKVEGFSLKNNHIEVKISIENRYKHFLKPNSVFWNHSGVDIKAGLTGVEIDTASLKSVIAGGISFDVIDGIEARKGQHRRLFESFKAAQNSGTQITLAADNTHGLRVGSEIRFQGVNVGQVISLVPDFQKDGVIIEATIFPEFAKKIVKSDTYFWAPTPKISISKAENLDSLFGAYIDVIPGQKGISHRFELHQTAEFNQALTLTLESESRGSVSVGTPILFRDFEVGSVTKVALGRFGDRVLIEVKVQRKYKHLVRQNTVFWNKSGLDVSIGLSGATIHSGTVESLIRGGISFATPETEKIDKPARMNQHFLLYKKQERDWDTWRTAIPSS